MPATQARFFYGWVIVAVATLALVVSNGLSIGGIPVFYKWIREDFVASGAIAAGAAESFIAFGASLTFLLSGLISPFAGWLIEGNETFNVTLELVRRGYTEEQIAKIWSGNLLRVMGKKRFNPGSAAAMFFSSMLAWKVS